MNPPSPDTQMQRQELAEMFTIWQSKLLHPLDSDRWGQLLQSTVKSLLAKKPLHSLSKVLRCGVGRIVGSPLFKVKISYDGGTVHVQPFRTRAPVSCTKYVSSASSDHQDTVRQASLAPIRCHWGSTDGTPPRDLSREKMAQFVDNGVKDIIDSSWRALGLTGAARDCVEKVGRQLRGLAVRCRGSSDRMEARKLLRSYLDSNRIEGFIQALVSWGQAKLAESEQTVFDEAFPFLRARQVQASRSRAELAEVGFGCSGGENDALELIKSQRKSSSQASHQYSQLRSSAGEHEQSRASVGDVPPLKPSPFSETSLGRVRESDNRTEDADEMWSTVDVQEDDGVPSVPPCDTREGGKGTFAKCSVEQRSKKRRVFREGGDEQPLSSVGVADGNGIEPSARVFADAGERVPGASRDRNEELASGHGEGWHGRERGFSNPKYFYDNVMGGEEEGEIETDEELIGSAYACGQTWGEEVKRGTENLEEGGDQKGLGKEKWREEQPPSPLLQSATDMQRIDLGGEESLHRQPLKEIGHPDGETLTC